MKPRTPSQLARVLDQLAASYPNGIPRESIRAQSVPMQDVSVEGGVARFEIFIEGEESRASDAARELLNGIISKGLRVESTDYSVTYAAAEVLDEAAHSSAAPYVIVFGAGRSNGISKRASGRPVLFTSSLEALVEDPTLKRALWRDLQALT